MIGSVNMTKRMTNTCTWSVTLVGYG